MIPIKDNIPTRTFPIITVGIIFVNISVFIWQSFLSPREEEQLFLYLGLIPRELTLALSSRIEILPYNLVTLFTSMFLHGGVFHVVGNMLYLWIFGNNIEDSFGHGRFAFFYLLSGVFAAIVQYLYDPLSNVPMIGASGAVSGVLGAYLVLYPYARVITLVFIFIFVKIVELPALIFLTFWFLMQFLHSGMEGVAWYAHIGGFIFGIFMGRLFAKRRVKRLWR
ncbi:MAG: rhomboid family intramembrane serine protease [Desulfobacterota bacterium]|nr:rhomboid family intramembrane serine protease [Thermodesulfobacteriota bacterium]MDW8001697.1 rhomboid family intramembrane serine protease [Deltaproteobacteria bacterium]